MLVVIQHRQVDKYQEKIAFQADQMIPHQPYHLLLTPPLHPNMFFQDSYIVQIVCKELKQHEMVVNELEDAHGEKNFFLADPGHLPFSFSCFTCLPNRLWYSSCDCDSEYGTIWVSSLFENNDTTNVHIQNAGPVFL